MNPNPEWRTVRIGLMVAVALVVFALIVVGITSRQKLFERKAEYFSAFPDAAGLKEGSGVWYQGVEVGFISKISFNHDPDAQNVQVFYRISSDLVPRIRTGTRASIRTLGLLGDKYLALTTPANTLNQPNLLPGHEIPIDKTVNLEALGRGAQDLINNTIELSKNINQLVVAFGSGQGAIPRLLNDPKLGTELIQHLDSMSRSIDQIAAGVATGEGLAGKMLVDRKYGEDTSRDLAESLRRTNEILTAVQNGKGAAGALISEKGEGVQIVANLAKTSEALARVAASLDRPGSLANKLFVDEAYGERLAANMLSISESLASILKKIDEGKGTAGALVNDRSVYDSLAVVAEGIRKSPMVNWYIQKKAEKAAEAARQKEGKD